MATRTFFRQNMLLFMLLLGTVQALAGYSSEDVTVRVGETKTLTLPSLIRQNSITTFFSMTYNGCLQKVSASRYSVTVKGLKASGAVILVTCNYQLGTFETGEHLFKVKVVDDGSSSSGTSGSKDTVTLPAEMTLEVGESKTVTAQTDAGMSVMWTWYSIDEEVATKKVSGRYYETATFTGVAPGQTSIMVGSNLGGTAWLQITVVQPVKAEKVDLYPVGLQLETGDESTLQVTVTPEDATDAELTWSSDNSEVVAVDGNGTVKALAAGKATVTVKTEGGLTAQCTVTVSDKPSVPALIISDADGLTDIPSVADVTYTRQFYKGWNSGCLPFTLLQTDLPAGCRLAVFQGPDSLNDAPVLRFIDCTQVDAGIPFLVHVPDDVTFVFRKEKVSLIGKPVSGGTVRGVFTRTVIGAGNYKLNAEGTAFGTTRTPEAVCAPFRFYIPVK